MKRLSMRKFHAREEWETGNAGKYIESFDKLTPNDIVFLIERVSNRERKRNLLDQDANLNRVVAACSAKVVGHIAKAISGFDPDWLRCAVVQAGKAGATVLLAETTDRFIRHLDFHSIKRPDLQATDEQLRQLVECTGGMKLMTHLHPDATPREVRSYQRRRGQRYKRNKGGRPKNRTAGCMTKRHEEKIELVKFLHARGWSYRKIAEKGMVKVPKSTVWEWINLPS